MNASSGIISVEVSGHPSPMTRTAKPPTREAAGILPPSPYWEGIKTNAPVSLGRNTNTLRVFELPDSAAGRLIGKCVDAGIEKCLAGQHRYCDQAIRNAETPQEAEVFQILKQTK